MPRKMSSRIQILLLSSIGVYRTIKEFYNQNLEEVWQLELSDSLSPYQSLITSAISGIILVRELTGHLYIATYFLILYPLIMGKLRSVLLLWMLVSGMRSVLLNMGVAVIGIILCSSRQEFTFSCFRFVAEEAIELGCSIYMWTVVNDYYHSLKRVSPRSHSQSPLQSSSLSNVGSCDEETWSSLLSDDWSLPSSLVEEFRRSTKENLPDNTGSVPDLGSRSVDSLLAQAMIDWLIKKIVKFRPKGENDGSSPSRLNKMSSNDIASLRKRIKKSIADVDENDIKDFLASESDRRKEEESKIEEVVKRTENEIVLVEGGCAKNDKEGVDMPDLINDLKENQEVCTSASYSTSRILKADVKKDEKADNIVLEPLNATNIVRKLFSDSFDSTIDKTIKRRNTEPDEKVKLEKSLVKDCENPSDNVTEKDSNEARVENEKAFNCSIAIVKSILDDAVDQCDRRGNNDSFYKPLNENYKNTEKEVSPLVERWMSIGENGLNLMRLQLDSEKRWDDLPANFRSVEKRVDAGRWSERELSADKENASIMKQDEPQMSAKAMRYHLRRTNQSRVPIQRRAREPALSGQTLKSIMKAMNLGQNPPRPVTINPNPQYTIKRVAESSSQTYASKHLMKKIREIENQQDHQLETNMDPKEKK